MPSPEASDISMIVQAIAYAFLSESGKSKVPRHMPLSSVMRKNPFEAFLER